MRVHIQTIRERTRCCKCGKAIKFGQHYTIVTTYPKSLADLKQDFKLRRQHYPDCENPIEGFGPDGMGKSYEEET